MLRRTLISAALATTPAVGISLSAQAQTEIQWWHSMTGGLNDGVVDLANGFNASQKELKAVPTYKGTYDESMTASIAAFRAGNAPHILQVYEVGTATMMVAKPRRPARKPAARIHASAGLQAGCRALVRRGHGRARRRLTYSFRRNSQSGFVHSP